MRKASKKALGLHVRHTHYCGNINACKNIILHNSPAEKFFDDALTRSLDDVPERDVHCFTAPCTAFNPTRENKGIADQNGALVFATIMYVQEKRPAAVLSENVATFAQKHEAAMQLLVNTIRGLGLRSDLAYSLSKDNVGIPQIRKRWYTQAVRNDALRPKSVVGGVHDWPEPLGTRIPLQRLITPARGQAWMPTPSLQPMQRMVIEAYEEAVGNNINPFARRGRPPVCWVLGECSVLECGGRRPAAFVVRGQADHQAAVQLDKALARPCCKLAGAPLPNATALRRAAWRGSNLSGLRTCAEPPSGQTIARICEDRRPGLL